MGPHREPPMHEKETNVILVCEFTFCLSQPCLGRPSISHKETALIRRKMLHRHSAQVWKIFTRTISMAFLSPAHDPTSDHGRG